jgi:hypothetical protein
MHKIKKESAMQNTYSGMRKGEEEEKKPNNSLQSSRSTDVGRVRPIQELTRQRRS